MQGVEEHSLVRPAPAGRAVAVRDDRVPAIFSTGHEDEPALVDRGISLDGAANPAVSMSSPSLTTRMKSKGFRVRRTDDPGERLADRSTV